MPNLFECKNVKFATGGSEIYINNELYNNSLSLESLTENKLKEIIADSVEQLFIDNGGTDEVLSINIIKEELSNYIDTPVYDRDVVEIVS